MEINVSEIYELVGKSPEVAVQRAIELLCSAKNQNEKDLINWARGYALVELKEFEKARGLWVDIFNRTNNHKALHQIGFVERSSDQIKSAIKTFTEERVLISQEDTVAIGANLYELTYCNHLLGHTNEAFHFFREYEKLNFKDPDRIERGCFFRLNVMLPGFQDTFSSNFRSHPLS